MRCTSARRIPVELNHRRATCDTIGNIQSQTESLVTKFAGHKNHTKKNKQTYWTAKNVRARHGYL